MSAFPLSQHTASPAVRAILADYEHIVPEFDDSLVDLLEDLADWAEVVGTDMTSDMTRMIRYHHPEVFAGEAP